MKKLLMMGFMFLTTSVFASNEVNVYSHRHYDSDKLLFKNLKKNRNKSKILFVKAEEEFQN